MNLKHIFPSFLSWLLLFLTWNSSYAEDAQPHSDFSANKTEICKADTVVFQDLSANAPNTWKWVVTPSTGVVFVGSDTDQNPKIIFNNDGVFDIQLTTTNADGDSTIVKPSYISVSAKVLPNILVSTVTNSVCDGDLVEFTSTLSNEGATPDIQWLINGVPSGIGATFSSSDLNNGQQVSAVLTSSELCTQANPVYSNGIVMTVSQKVTPDITISAPKSVICDGESLSFLATTNNGGATPTIEWLIDGFVTGTTGSTFTRSTFVDGQVISARLTSSDPCATPSQVVSNDIALTVNPILTPNISIDTDSTVVCDGDGVVFTADIINGGGAPIIEWYVNAAKVNAGPTFTSFSLNNGDVISAKLKSSEACISSPVVNSNSITLTVQSYLTPSITIGTTNTTICNGDEITFNTVLNNEGATPEIEWLVSNVPKAIGTSYTASDFADGSTVIARLRSSELCISSTVVNSNIVNMTVIPNVLPVVFISSPKSTICDGENLNFSSSITNSGATPTIDWKVNGNIQGGGATFSTSTLVNGDIVSASLTSSAQCPSPKTVESNDIIVTVKPIVAPTVSIIKSADSICTGQTVVFSPSMTNEGTNPSITWYDKTGSVLVTTPNYSSSSFTNADSVYVEIISNDICLSTTFAQSNQVGVKVKPYIAPTIQINTDSTNVCEAYSTTFTANLFYGGPSPTIEWIQVGVDTAFSGTTYSTVSLQNGKKMKARLTSSAQCPSPLVATSNEITMSVIPNKLPEIQIQALADTICEGQPVTYTSSLVNAGSSPTVDWYINNSFIQSGSIFTTSALTPGDSVYAKLTSSIVCPLPQTVPSNVVKVEVVPVLMPDIDIAASKLSTCQGDLIEFTSSVFAEGNNPTINWYSNSFTLLHTGPTYQSDSINDGDLITARLVSNYRCLVANNVTSNGLTFSIQSPDSPTIIIDTDTPTLCEDSLAYFTTDLLYEGTLPQIDWLVNNVPTGVGTDFSYAPQNGDVVRARLISNATCVTNNLDTSNSITIQTNTLETPLITVSTPSTDICSDQIVTLTTETEFGGGAPFIEWRVNGGAPVATGNTYTANFADGDVVTANLTSDRVCLTDTTVVSNATTFNHATGLVPELRIVPNEDTICAGGCVSFKAEILYGGQNPFVDWKINGASFNFGPLTYSTCVLSQGDFVEATLTSDESCVSTNFAYSPKVFIEVLPLQNTDITIVANKTNICSGDTVDFLSYLTNEGSSPEIEWFVNNVSAHIGPTYSTDSLADSDLVYANLTSSVPCPVPAIKQSNTVSFNVTTTVTPSIDITSPNPNACIFDTVLFTSSTVNGGTFPKVDWYVNGTKVADSSDTFSTSSLNNFDKVYATVKSDIVCVRPRTVLSDTIQVGITNAFPTSIDIAATSETLICAGEELTFYADYSNGGINPLIEWFVDGVGPIATGDTIYDIPVFDGDTITARLTSSITCALPKSIVSVGLPIKDTSTVLPAVHVTQLQDVVCLGEDGLFVADIYQGGKDAIVEWYINSSPTGETGLTFSKGGLKPNDKVSARLTSSKSCADPKILFSELLTVRVSGFVDPKIVIVTNSTDICENNVLQFYTAIQNGGNNPQVEWFKNGSSTGHIGLDYIVSDLDYGDYIYAELESDAPCAIDGKVTSQSYHIETSQQFQPSIAITSNKTSICEGDTILFTATTVNKGDTGLVDWYVNDTLRASSSDTTFAFYDVQEDIDVLAVLRSSLKCRSLDSVSSLPISIRVHQYEYPTISIDASSLSICDGDSALITATLSDASDSVIVWYQNGLQSATFGENEYYATGLQDGDKLYAMLKNDKQCSVNDSVYSDTLTFEVIPIVTPSVVISRDKLFYCEGEDAVLTATVTPSSKEVDFMWNYNKVALPNSDTNKLKIINVVDRDSVYLNYSYVDCYGQTIFGKTNGVTLAVRPLEPVSLNLVKDTICQNEPAFNLEGGEPIGGTFSGVPVINNQLVPDTSGAFAITYTVIGSNECPSTAVDTFVVNPNPTPVIYLFNDTLYTDAPGFHFQWKLDDKILKAGPFNYVPLSGTGDYSVRVLNEFGCLAYSNAQFFVTGIEDIVNVNFKIYPIPADDQLTIESRKQISELKVFDAEGKEVKVNFTIENQTRLKVGTKDLPVGKYHIQFELLGETKVVPFLINR